MNIGKIIKEERLARTKHLGEDQEATSSFENTVENPSIKSSD